MTRHTFKADVMAPGSGKCAVDFGGVAVCDAVLSDPVHWQDDDHPFATGHTRGTEMFCGYTFSTGGQCGGSVDDPAHRADVPRELPKRTTLRDPAEAVPKPDWADLVQPVPLRRNNARLIIETAPAWQTAAAALREDGGEVRAGEWEWRKYVLLDMVTTEDMCPGRSGLRAIQDALLFVGQSFSVSVYRPRGRTYRIALVTWGPFEGKKPGEIEALMDIRYGGV